MKDKFYEAIAQMGEVTNELGTVRVSDNIPSVTKDLGSGLRFDPENSGYEAIMDVAGEDTLLGRVTLDQNVPSINPTNQDQLVLINITEEKHRYYEFERVIGELYDEVFKK